MNETGIEWLPVILEGQNCVGQGVSISRLQCYATVALEHVFEWVVAWVGARPARRLTITCRERERKENDAERERAESGGGEGKGRTMGRRGRGRGRRCWRGKCNALGGRASVTSGALMSRRKNELSFIVFSCIGLITTDTVRLFLSTNATLACVLSDIKSAVILCIFVSFRPFTDISATVTQIGVKVCYIDGRSIIRTQSLPFWWRYL